MFFDESRRIWQGYLFRLEEFVFALGLPLRYLRFNLLCGEKLIYIVHPKLLRNY